MRNQLLVIFVLLILAIFVALHLNAIRKQKNEIRKKWGTIPRITRKDREESLHAAYEKLRPYHDFDSEVDDITWYDLDLFQVFNEINHTHSSVGSEALYRQLRLFHFDDTDLEKIEELIEFYEDNPELREKIEYIFTRLGKKDQNSVVQYLTDPKKNNVSSLAFFILLGLLPIGGLLLIFSGIDGIGFGILFGSVVFNILYSSKKKVDIDIQLMSLGYLIQTLNTAKKLSKVKQPLQSEISPLLKPFKSVLRFSFAFSMNDHSELGILLDYLNILFMIPFIAYHFVFNQIKKHEKEAILLWQLLGDLEVGYAILNYRKTLSLWTQPTFVENEDVSGAMVYHPLIEKPVPNPVAWTQNTLVSGSNASGKSTYVKSVAINCVLAQTINTCLAESFSMQRGHILTSMAVEDDVLKGDSYFVAEIKSLKRILDQVKTTERCYLFIDEILRGTNTVERIAASSSIINWIADYSSLAFVATHDVELTEILKDQCKNVHFKEKVTARQGVQFDYVLQKGPATSRNAILLLQTMDFPKDVVENAQKRAGHFDQTQEWLNFEH